jgi:N-acetylneuraminate synthase
MIKRIKIADRWIGTHQPTFIIAEIGINHNGDLGIAKQLIDAAVAAGCDAVKFQKRTPDLCVPPDQRDKMRDSPWGYISYIDYRHKVEFEVEQYHEIDRYCRENGILWFASCWDIPSVDFIEQFNPCCHKIPSACLTDYEMIGRLRQTGRPLILSTGMSTMDEIYSALEVIGFENLILCHSTSTYPCPPNELNLSVIRTLDQLFPCPIGYSGHEVGLVPSVAAVTLGACLIERHITLDRAMWGSDQAASVEPGGLQKLAKYIRTMEQAMGDGVKKVYDSERLVMQRLRRRNDTGTVHGNWKRKMPQPLMMQMPNDEWLVGGHEF